MTYGRLFRTIAVIALLVDASLGAQVRLVAPSPSRDGSKSSTVAGQTATRLPDGRWLFVGGEGEEASTVVWTPETGALAQTTGHLLSPRARHSATVLPDGTVLIAGGHKGSGLVETPEVFDPGTNTFTPFTIVGATARQGQSATLLLDGRVLVVGGSNGGTASLGTELWDLPAHTATLITGANMARVAHSATLTADGGVLISGGASLNGRPASDALVVDPATGRIVAPHPVTPSLNVAASIPAQGATDVAPDARLAIRFSDAPILESVTEQTMTLAGPDGPVESRVIAAEDGRLAFVWPAAPLADDTVYVLSIAGVVDRAGTAMRVTSIRFTTRANPVKTTDPGDDEEWVPDVTAGKDGWRSNRPPSPWETLAPLLAPPGVTAISGRVLTLDGRPLPDVTLAVESGAISRSDRTGRFLLTLGARSGRTVLQIDGASASRPGRQYGFFEYGLSVVAGQTTVLPFTIWQPRLDLHHVITIPSPTTNEVVVTTPYIAGLELHLPPQTTIVGRDGKPVTQVGITPIPVDRPPFPLAKNVDVPVYFTIQPGSAYVRTAGSGPHGAQIVYPNYRDGLPGQVYQFFHYDPDGKDWYVYGTGAVTRDSNQVVPAPNTRVYEFTGAMINGLDSPPGSTTSDSRTMDPVDPATGIFVMQKVDLYLPDVIPLALTRSYQSGDGVARPYGIGMTHPYAMFLWSANQYQEADLFLPDGRDIHYVRTSPGNGIADAVFEHTATPTVFYKSTIVHAADEMFNGVWHLTLADGTMYVFGENAPLQSIRDRYGNAVVISHSNGTLGNVTRVTSPNGRWMEFSYDAASPRNRITQVKDNLGRTVSYTYDANGNLSTVTDPANNVTTCTYDSSHRMLTIKDGRNIVYLTNEYTNGRVTKQTQADSSVFFQASYTTDQSGNVTRTDITNPRGYVRRLAFNSAHYVTSVIQAVGTSVERTTTIERQSGSNLVTAIVDPLSRRTEWTYNSVGQPLTITRLAGTSDAVTTTFTYEPHFHLKATVTDPLNDTWTASYDTAGRLTSISDPLSHATTITTNSSGQVTSLTDALTHTWQFGYTGADLTSITDPLNGVRSQFVDEGGRVLAATGPLGAVTRLTYDALNRVSTLTDPLSGQTSFSYDPNGRLLSLTDALTHATGYTWDASDRVATRTDPLTHSESYTYDGNNNLTQIIDRRSQVTGYTYDALDRLSQVTFSDSSTITYTYDAGDRVTQIADSANGTIARTYDGRNRPTEETTPQGTVDYTYDAAGRRASMTVAGQTQVTYTYDNANRLTGITQGTASVAVTYDDADRRSTLTYPNGIVATYGYDAANRMTSLSYAVDQTTLGTLTYTYDVAGNRTGAGGTWARTGIPPALTSATYDAGNRIATWGGTTLSYDLNGNLTSDGTATYTWNARDQLTALGGNMTASFVYDGVGRRRGKTISGTTTNFLYDGVNFVQEQNNSGTPVANLLTGLAIDESFTRTDAGGVSSLLVDGLGSILELADASGTLQTHYTFEPFGAATVSGATSTNAQLYTGREDDGTSLTFYRARFYRAMYGRFVSEDPIGFRGADVNLNAYVHNNPIGYRDPSGHFAPLLVLPIAGCVGGAAGAAIGDAMSGRKFSWHAVATGCGVGAVIGLGAAALGLGAGAEAAEAIEAAEAAEVSEATEASQAIADGQSPLRLLHDESSLSKSSLDYWSRQSTEDIVNSLGPDAEESLQVKLDGTVMDGNTRLTVLKGRGYPVNTLPRLIYPPR